MINNNRKIILTKSNPSFVNEDENDWRHTIKNIFSNDENLKEISTKGNSFKRLLDDIGDSSIVSSDVHLLMTSQPKLETTNDFRSTSGNVEKILDSANNAFNFATSLLPEPFGSILSASNKITNKGIEAAAGLYGPIQSVKASSSKEAGTTGLAFNPWYDNLSAWGGASSNISFSYSFDFHLGQFELWNAKQEVYLPILNLLVAASPRYLTDFGISGPFLNNTDTTWSMIKGTQKSFEESMKKNYNNGYWGHGYYKEHPSEINNINAMIATLQNSIYPFTYNMRFGNMLTLNHVIIKDCHCTFSNEVDGEGFPISGEVVVDFSTILPLVLGTENNDTLSVKFGI